MAYGHVARHYVQILNLGVKIDVQHLTPRHRQSSVGRNDCGIQISVWEPVDSPSHRPTGPFAGFWSFGTSTCPPPGSDARHTVRLHKAQGTN